MNTVRLLFFSFFLGCLCLRSYAQTDQTSIYHASLEAQGVLTSKDHVPFWMRSDQFGSVPLAGASGSLIGAVRKDYDSSEPRLVDWGASVELRGDLGSSSRATLIEGYAKLRVSIFELKAGRSKEFMGLVDSTLSSGAFSSSGNALGIPKIQGSIPQYWSIPVFGDLFAFKGNFAYGWFGNEPVQSSRYVKSTNAYYNQSSFYGRFGKPDWNLKLYAGFNHQVMWGDERSIFGPKYGLSSFKTFEYAVIGKTHQGSKVGNHLGSVDLGLDYDFPGVRLSLYRQSFYDEGALSKLANIADGLNGVSLTNTSGREDLREGVGEDEGGFKWHKVIFELFYSKDQAGYPWSRRTNSGDEDYYNNFEYYEGWSYKGQGLGNPFITPSSSTRKGFPNVPADYFNNNRVVAFYGGMQGSVGSYQFTAKGSYSLNYGTFGTSQWGFSTGGSFHPPSYGIFKEVKQFSAYLDVSRYINDGWTAGATAGFDNGGLLYNTGGVILKLRKTFY